MDNMEEIMETTVGDLDGTGVGAANIGRDNYTLPDGTARVGLTAQLFIFTGEDKSNDVIVGQGSIITAGKSRWEVVSVDRERGKRGTVTLKRLED